MGEIETVEAEKMGWLDLPRGTSYPTFPYSTSRPMGTESLVLFGPFLWKLQDPSVRGGG